jgi:hypothetical protein
MFTPIRAIHTFLRNTIKNNNTVNLHHHQTLFYDQMLVASKMELSPKIQGIFLTPTTKKIIFDKIQYFPMEDMSLTLQKKDIEEIQIKYKLLYNHSRFIPLNPYLGYQSIHPNYRKWYIWSYTDLKFVDGNKEFMNQLYDLKYNKNPFFQHYIMDFIIDHDCKKK